MPTIVAALLLFRVSAAGADDWSATVRTCLQQNDRQCARAAVEERLRTSPSDVEALTWRARLLAWNGQFAAAEAQYLVARDLAPSDGDILVGLADVQLWRGSFQQALRTLSDAERLQYPGAEVLPRRARALEGLGRRAEALRIYEELLVIDPSNTTARSRLEMLRENTERKHMLRIGSEVETFNYADPATTQTLAMASNWNRKWGTHFAGTFYRRFGQGAGKLSAGVTYHLNAHHAVTAAAAAANAQDVAARREASIEYGFGTQVSGGALKAIELYAQQRNYWFTVSRVGTFGGSALAHLSHDLTITLSIAAARTSFAAGTADWTTVGSARFAFPIQPRLRADVAYGVGSEDFSQIDQIGRVAARSAGGGLSYRITPTQEISTHVIVQDRSHRQSQVNVEVGYGVRF